MKILKGDWIENIDFRVYVVRTLLETRNALPFQAHRKGRH